MFSRALARKGACSQRVSALPRLPRPQKVSRRGRRKSSAAAAAHTEHLANLAGAHCCGRQQTLRGWHGELDSNCEVSVEKCDKLSTRAATVVWVAGGHSDWRAGRGHVGSCRRHSTHSIRSLPAHTLHAFCNAGASHTAPQLLTTLTPLPTCLAT